MNRNGRETNELIVDEPLDADCRLDKPGRGRKCDICRAQLYVDEHPYRCNDCFGVVQCSPSNRGFPFPLFGDANAQPSPPRVYRRNDR